MLRERLGGAEEEQEERTGHRARKASHDKMTKSTPTHTTLPHQTWCITSKADCLPKWSNRFPSRLTRFAGFILIHSCQAEGLLCYYFSMLTTLFLPGPVLDCSMVSIEVSKLFVSEIIAIILLIQCLHLRQMFTSTSADAALRSPILSTLWPVEVEVLCAVISHTHRQVWHCPVRLRNRDWTICSLTCCTTLTSSDRYPSLSLLNTHSLASFPLFHFTWTSKHRPSTFLPYKHFFANVYKFSNLII